MAHRKRIHFVTVTDSKLRLGVCANCGSVSLIRKGKNSKGEVKFACENATTIKSTEFSNQSKHVLNNVNWNTKQAECSVCGVTNIHNNRGNAVCSGLARAYNNTLRSGYNYSKHKKEFCEACGFIPLNLCQLAVDHIDNDRTNNDLENLQTLCHNCHSIKTWRATYERS
jgi:hypothetical protein